MRPLAILLSLALTLPGTFAYGAVTPVNAVKTVTTAGTRIQATATTSIHPSSVYFEALGTNTGFIYIGLSNVSATVYIARLSPGQGISMGADTIGSDLTLLQLSNFYIDSSVNGEKVQMTYQNHIGGN